MASQSIIDALRRSDNIDDRRKEMFQSFPQAQQAPNVFADNLGGYQGLMNLSQGDFAPMQQSPLASAAGADSLDDLIRRYLAARQ